MAIRVNETHELKFRRWRAESLVERVRQEAKLQTNRKVRVGKDLSMAERTAKAGVISVSPLQRTGSPQEPSRVHLAVDNTISVPTLTFYSLTPTVFCPTQYVKPPLSHPLSNSRLSPRLSPMSGKQRVPLRRPSIGSNMNITSSEARTRPCRKRRRS